jgi:hypothetical protein
MQRVKDIAVLWVEPVFTPEAEIESLWLPFAVGKLMGDLYTVDHSVVRLAIKWVSASLLF